jgi:hypothetical protein
VPDGHMQVLHYAIVIAGNVDVQVAQLGDLPARKAGQGNDGQPVLARPFAGSYDVDRA